MGDEVKTIKDLLDWAIEHNAFNLALSLQYQVTAGIIRDIHLGRDSWCV